MNHPAQHRAGKGSATTQPGPSSEGSDRAGPEVHLWREVAYIAGFYVLYSIVRQAWVLWCAFALVPLLRHRWARLPAVLYPVITIWAVVVTGNHFWLDAVGGALVLAAGYAAARLVQAVMVNRSGDADTVTSELTADAGAARSASPGSADGRRSTSQDTFAP